MTPITEESPESPTAMHEIDDSDDLPVRRPSNHLVTAIIESSTNPMMQPRECVTPPPNLSLQGKILGLILSIITLVFYDLKEDF